MPPEIVLPPQAFSPQQVRPGRKTSLAAARAHLPGPQVWIGPAVITSFLWFTSLNQVSFVQAAAAFVLLLLAWWSYWNWHQKGHQGLPVFAAITAMYWLYFGVQVFWGDRKAMDWRHPGRVVGEAAVTEAMLVVVLGILCLRLGMNTRLGRGMAPKRLPEVSWKPLNRLYLMGILAAGTVLMGRYDNLAVAAGEGGRQIVGILLTTPCLAATAILLARILDGKAKAMEKILLLAVLALRGMLGVSSGWVGSAIGLALVCTFVYLQKRKKLPLVALSLLIPYVLFFQAGKQEFRRTFWYGDVQAGPIEKVEFWVDASFRTWQRAFDDPSGRGVAYLLAFSLSRTSLLSQAANVMEQTPAFVPYQYGRLYSYLPVALIPRLFWPDKPSMNDANRLYQVVYGLTPERDLNHISIAVGALTEGYISFGWAGSMLIMFLIGFLLDFWNEAFFRDSTSLAAAIGVAMLPQLLIVESQMAQYVSGLLQHVLLTAVIFLPVMRFPRKARQTTPAFQAFRTESRFSR